MSSFQQQDRRPRWQPLRRDEYLEPLELAERIRTHVLCPNASHSAFSVPEDFRRFCEANEIPRLSYYSAGNSGVALGFPDGKHLLKINWSGRCHTRGHPALLKSPFVDLVPIDGKCLVATWQPIIPVHDVTAEDCRRIAHALEAVVPGVVELDTQDTGVVVFGGQRVPLCFDVHDLVEGGILRPATKRIEPWITPAGEWIQDVLFPELRDTDCGIPRSFFKLDNQSIEADR